MFSLSKSRTITIAVSLTTLLSNVLSSLLFSQLPDDPYHLAINFGWYLHFANILSVFGLFGALREHALSIALFSNYLLLDTVLCSIPRFLILSLLNQFTSSVCTSLIPFSSTPVTLSASTSSPPQQPTLHDSSETHCSTLLSLLQFSLLSGLLLTTLLQFIGALCVREYAKSLFMREIRQEAQVLAAIERRSLCEERGLPVIFEGETPLDEKSGFIV